MPNGLFRPVLPPLIVAVGEILPVLPAEKTNTLTATEVRRLYRAIVETLADAIKHRGSSLADEQYRDLFGEIGDFQGSHQVYDREGQPCRRCRNTIVRVKAGGRSTFFCEHCQV